MNKTCTKCKIVKSINDFGNQKKQRNGKSPICKKCRSLDKARWLKTEKGQAWRKQYARNRWRKVKIWLLEQMHTTHCSKCEESHPACLEFHHIKDKHFVVSQQWRTKTNKEQLINEIKKCIVLCANCHRKEHWVN